MSDLITFLRQRLDEDYAAAKAAQDEASDFQLVGSELAEAHILRWKPDKVMTDVEIKRRILALHEPTVKTWPKADGMAPHVERHCTECGSAASNPWLGNPEGFEPTDWPCPTVRLLVSEFAEQEGYREEWRP